MSDTADTMRLPISDQQRQELRRLARVIAGEPFRGRAWGELAFFVVSCAWAYAWLIALGFIGLIGALLTIVFVGLLIVAGGLRAARAVGRTQRALAEAMVGEAIPSPDPFSPPPGFFPWLRAALLDTTAWRNVLYLIAKVPLGLFGAWFALSIWLRALASLLSAVIGNGLYHVGGWGILATLLGSGDSEPGPSTWDARLGLLLLGGVLLLLAPWPMRLVTEVDRRLMRILLGPDPSTARVRTLEVSRAKTVDAASATLRRIERDLHDGTQAQLVALAMQLGQAKEKLAAIDAPANDGQLASARELVEEAHRGVKEAIADLRDLARGIHPPSLDTGLENSLLTLGARSSVPTDVAVAIDQRPSASIEAIGYFCAAELLANVAQHSHATHASLSCSQHGPWLRLVVRDNGRGGADIKRDGSSSSGLAGLADRVSAVDGQISIASPNGGPTSVTIDLPSHT